MGGQPVADLYFGKGPRELMPRNPAKALVARLAAVLATLSAEDIRWHLAKKLRR